jgi:antitoxin (DNA-binding transcriptional repressor) of toxin-antitoxin stability system
MEVSITEARKRLSELIRAVEAGERVIITRRGKQIAELSRPPASVRKVVFGGMKGRVKFLPGWDDPIDEDLFLAGDL